MAVKFDRGRALHLIDLTPMIDMLFALLIFFMVVSSFAAAERDMHVELPSANEAMPLTVKPQVVTVNIDRQGRYYVHNREITEPELARALRTASANNPTNQTVVIRADKRTTWDYVATAMRLCNEAGIRDYSASLAEE
jgi:Biopolymer transport protein